MLLLQAAPLHAQQFPIRPGEAFVTRFSGTMPIPGPGGTAIPVINPGGVVGSVIDLRNPNQPPQGQHWIGEPQRLLVTAADVGQVFGVAFDDAPVPNIYLAATAAFGLHRMPGSAQWMPGMWGAGGGPGTIYRLGPATNYRPQPFANLTLGGRQNTGASLGNIAYDRWNRQLYASDLETGMIHRIRAADGADLGAYDHGVRGRANFFDASSGRQSALPPIPFNPSTRARIADCTSGNFDNAPECWNIAPSGRRIWGLGVWRNTATNEVRLYYAVWSSPAFDPQTWLAMSDDDKRNSVWSVGIGADGSFNQSSIRREFVIPDFFTKPEDIARAGFSQPVSDVAFPACPGLPLMLVAERGGMRNLGLGEQSPFATPHEARAIRYELHQDGVWRPIGRYEVGFYDRANEGDPRMRANCAGGASFGPGYSSRWTAEQNRPDNYVWITGDDLCSPNGPCNLAAVAGQQQAGDDSEVHGVQGIREDFFDEVAPAAAYGLAPEQQNQSGQVSSVGPDEAYLIDVNINMTPAGAPIAEEFVRNDSTLVGDIAVFQICAPQPVGVVYPLPPPPPVLIVEPGHDPGFSHSRFGSHGQQQSHYRFASHWPAMSHQRFGSHNEYWSHYRYASHNLNWSHNRFGSHSNKETHNKLGSHQPVQSHFANASKVHLLQLSHKQFASHSLKESLTDKLKDPSPVHTLAKSLADKGLKQPDPIHTPIKSAVDKGLKIPDPVPVHTVAKSAVDKLKDAKHNAVQSAIQDGKLKVKEPEPKHNPIQSAAADKLKADEKHNAVQSAVQDGKLKVKEPEPKHNPIQSAGPDKLKTDAKHNPVQSAAQDSKLKIKEEPKHNQAVSNAAKQITLPPKGTTPPPPPTDRKVDVAPKEIKLPPKQESKQQPKHDSQVSAKTDQKDQKK
jgi:hypothetical protein